MFWYPLSVCTNKEWYYQLHVVLCHMLPGFIGDCYARMNGRKAYRVNIRNILVINLFSNQIFVLQVRMYKKAFKALSAFDYFFSKQWRFISKNSAALWSKISIQDRKIFFFDVREINWISYFETYVLGIRRFILKDDISSLAEAKKNVHR